MGEGFIFLMRKPAIGMWVLPVAYFVEFVSQYGCGDQSPSYTLSYTGIMHRMLYGKSVIQTSKTPPI